MTGVVVSTEADPLADTRPSAPAQASNAGVVVQTDFELSIDGEWVVGTYPHDANTAYSKPSPNAWSGEFSTHDISQKSQGVGHGIRLLNHAGESFTITAKKGRREL